MSKRRGPGALLAIAIFKLLKAVLLVGLGVAALFLARDSASWATLERFADALRFGPDNRLIDRALAALSGLSARRLEELSIATFIYAAVFTTEGAGLLMGKRWAEYLTTLVTASFIPFELYELIHGPSALKVLGLLVNGLIVVYLARRLLKR
jgi:uncharacterized membrane protein (DUF2068 family)